MEDTVERAHGRVLRDDCILHDYGIMLYDAGGRIGIDGLRLRYYRIRRGTNGFTYSMHAIAL